MKQLRWNLFNKIIVLGEKSSLLGLLLYKWNTDGTSPIFIPEVLTEQRLFSEARKMRKKRLCAFIGYGFIQRHLVGIRRKRSNVKEQALRPNSSSDDICWTHK